MHRRFPTLPFAMALAGHTGLAGCGARSDLGDAAATPPAQRSPWPMRGADPQNRGRGLAPALQSPKERWSLSVLDPDGAVSFASPAIAADGTLYLQRGNAGTVIAVAPAGTVKWEHTAVPGFGGSSESSPAIGADGTIYVGAGTGLLALDPEGHQRWLAATTSPVRGSPVIAPDGTILCGDEGGRLYAVDAGGVVLWSLPLAVDALLLEWTPTVAADGTVYAAVGKALHAIKDGAEQWSADLSDGSQDGAHTPSIADDGTIVVPVRAQVFAFRPDGALRWSYAFDAASGTSASSSAALAADGTAYVSVNIESPFSGAVVAIGADGALAGSTPTEFSAGPMPATIAADDSVYTTDPVQIVHPGGAVTMTGLPVAQAITPVVIGAEGTFYLVYDGALHAFGK
jgi:outer membrane protein assembly factor BamB